MSTHHGELIHRILLEVIEDLTIIGLVQKILTGLPKLHLRLVLTWATDATALADHTLDEILRELAELEKCQRNVALLATGCCTKLDTGRILVPLTHHLHNRVCNAAGCCEALAPDGRLLIRINHRLHLHILRGHHRGHLAKCENVVCIALDPHLMGLGLLRDARSDKYSRAARVGRLQVSGNRAHRGNGLRHVLLKLLREMHTQHVDECRTAGGRHLLTFLTCLGPLLCLVRCGHIAAETDLDHVGEADFLQCLTDGAHGDVLTELTFDRRCTHREDFLAGLDVTDDIEHIDLRCDRAERTAVDTLTTADALLIVDLTDAVLVVADGIDRTRLTARTLQMRDGTIRTRVRTHTTLLTLVRIDVRSRLGHGDRTEAAAVLARLTEAETAVIGYRISG